MNDTTNTQAAAQPTAERASDASDCSPAVRFHFIEFNPRRFARGARAARFEVAEGEERFQWLWMSKHDILNNIRDFGDGEELQKGLAAYRKPYGDAAE